MNKSLNSVIGNEYTLFTYESNIVGEDLLLTISDETYSVTSIFDRYLDDIYQKNETPDFRLGSIVFMKDKGKGIGQIVLSNYYDRLIRNWNTSFSLKAFTGWEKVVFDGENPGDIYDMEENIIPMYKVMTLGSSLYITQDLSPIEGEEFTASVFDQIFTYPNGLVLQDLDVLKELSLISNQQIDCSTIGLNEMSRYGLFEFMETFQLQFKQMETYYITQQLEE